MEVSSRHSRVGGNPEKLITGNIDIWSSAIKRKSAAGRGRSNKQELYGIKKLRELILELAVRGLLVPQDPSDEPASELLKKIAAEKATLLKEGKLKKQKPLPSIEDYEKPFALPEGWDWCRLGDVTDIVRGITFSASEKSKIPGEGRVACLRTTNVQDKIEWDDLLFIRDKFVKRENQFIQKNDIVMSMANSRELVGKVAIITDDPKFKTSFGGFLGVIRPLTLDAYFVMSLFRVPTNRDMLIDSASQTTNIANISLAKLNPMVFSVPPLAEQHRIVAKVDELMALCDQLEQQQSNSISAHQTLVKTLLGALTTASEREGFTVAWSRIAAHFHTLFTTESSIDQLKQTILQLAVMGKLVPQDPNDEPASVLLKKIAQEKAKLIKEGKIKKQKVLPEIGEDEKPFKPPVRWSVSRLGTFTNVGTGATPARDRTEYWMPQEISWVASGETSNDYITETNEKVSSLAVKETNVTLYPIGTLIVAMYGQGKTRGQVTELMIEAGTNQACVAVVLINKDEAHRKYLKLFFKKAYEEMRSHSAGGAQPNLNVGKISNTVIPLPPLAEQQRIAVKVSELMTLCDTLKARLNTAQTTQLQLADCLVEQALG